MSYQQLTEGKRYQISALLAAGYSQARIARAIGVHPGTIGRELARNRSSKGYEPERAQHIATERRPSAPKQTALFFAEHLLGQQWCPEQTSNVGEVIKNLTSL